MTKYIPGKYFTGAPCKNGHVAERWKYNGMCVECKKSADKPSNAKAGKKYRIKTLYGLTTEQVEVMKHSQNHKCGICETSLEDNGHVQIDHCHTNGNVRGLLCITCNWLLGHSKDDPNLLRRAAEYIERFKGVS